MRLLILAIAVLFALLGCQKTDPPGEAPTNVHPEPGDGLVVVSWDMLPDLTYWIFFEPGSSVAVATPESFAIRGAVSPRLITNLQNDTQYAFVMNATHNDSAAGPNSLAALATPRLAGDSWSPGTALSPPQNLKSLALGAVLGVNRLVAVGDAATIFAGDFNYTSTGPNPGVTAWTQVPATQLPQPFASNLSSVIFNGSFVALGTDGSIISSADGVNWNSNAPVGASGMNGLAFAFLLFNNAPTYVAVGNGGQIFTTTTLAGPWNPVGVGVTASDLTSVSLLNGSFVVTGTGGTLLISGTAGANDWTPLTSNTTNTLRSVAFKPISLDIHYVAVGDAGTIITNPGPDPNTHIWPSWTIVPPPFAQNLQSVTVGGATASRFLAVGQGGAVVYSDDGVSWTTRSAGASNNLASVLFPFGLYLAVGDAGANVVSKQ